MLKVWTNLPEALIPEAVCCGVSEAAGCTPTKTAVGPEGDFLAPRDFNLREFYSTYQRYFTEAYDYG